MLRKFNKNITFFRRYWLMLAPKALKSTPLMNSYPDKNSELKTPKEYHMSPVKNFLLFAAKLLAFLILINMIVLKPLGSAISKSLENFDNNPLIKIISLDFINNPLTFIRMAEYYYEKNDVKKAELYLEYAEIIKTRYPYPTELNSQVQKLRLKIKDSSK